ncbi:MAG: T9SS type A sorting domain-containing protein [Bacteroidota bacterium]
MKKILVFLSLLSFYSASGQDCFLAGHSTNENDSWLSCEEAPGPNPNRGTSHWVMYDLGYVYSLGSTHFWNYNVAGETANGMRELVIDVSLDGTVWTEVGTTFLQQATGTADYEGEVGLYLGQSEARYVLFTVRENWGGNCVGLSEVRFDLEGTVSLENEPNDDHHLTLFPNPASQVLYLETDLAIQEVVLWDAAGREVMRQKRDSEIDLSGLPAGLYWSRVIGAEQEMVIRSFIKQ